MAVRRVSQTKRMAVSWTMSKSMTVNSSFGFTTSIHAAKHITHNCKEKLTKRRNLIYIWFCVRNDPRDDLEILK